LALLACNKIEIDLTIFERKPIVKLGMSLQRNNVQYESKFPAKKFDIVHIGSSLQYFYDFQGLIKQIIDTEPTYIIITDTAISPLPTFEAIQLNLVSTKIIRWIFNVDELNELMQGYTLVHRSHNYTPQHRFKSRKNKKLEVFHGNLIYMRSQG
jgi:putative methyltransferase (TIGR04325 family)